MVDALPPAESFQLAPNSDRSATIRDEPGLLNLPPEAQSALARPRLDADDAQRYAVGDLVGSGATSQVFSATDMVFDRQIAIKFMANDQDGAAKRIARFIREAKLTAALEHPNVAPIYDLNFAKGGAVYLGPAEHRHHPQNILKNESFPSIQDCSSAQKKRYMVKKPCRRTASRRVS